MHEKHFIDLTNLEGQWQGTREKLNLFCACIYYPGTLESCGFLAKDNFVRATFWKFGVVCGCTWKKAEASRKFYIIYKIEKLVQTFHVQ